MLCGDSAYTAFSWGEQRCGEMPSPAHRVFRGLFFVLQEQVYLVANKSHLPWSQKMKPTDSESQ